MLAGVVLAGGSSRRMGAPKALADVDGVPMGRRVADALRAAGADPVVLQGGPASTGAALGLDVVDDEQPGAGPLAALASATRWAAAIGADLVVVAACDQPDLTAATLRALRDGLGLPPAAALGAVPVSDDGRRHPFPAVWRTTAAPALRTLVAGGARRADAALALGVVEVVVGAAELADVDTPEDLADRQRSARQRSAPHDRGGTGP